MAAYCYRPIAVPDIPTYEPSRDVTIIVPTVDADEASFLLAAQSWLANRPREVIIVTQHDVLPQLQRLVDRLLANQPVAVDDYEKNLYTAKVRVTSVAKANKRTQMVHGVLQAKTDIIVFADDDALWPPTLLPLVLACFEDQSIGGVGTSQVVEPTGKDYTLFETLAAFRLSIRNIEIAASTRIDGGLQCLSGRTAAYRACILKEPDFVDAFVNDYWIGKYRLNSGDDKFLTRWLVKEGWSMYVQCAPGAEIRSTMRPDWRFLKQVSRWTRNTWRSDIRSLFVERHIWSRHPYCAYTMVDKMLNPFTLLAGPCLVIYLCIKSGRGGALAADSKGSYHLPPWNILVSWFVWLTVTRGFKLLPHFIRRPQDVIYIPLWILFGYYFAFLKIYALFTLHKTGWNTRESVPDPEFSGTSSSNSSVIKTAIPSDTETTFVTVDADVDQARPRTAGSSAAGSLDEIQPVIDPWSRQQQQHVWHAA